MAHIPITTKQIIDEVAMRHKLMLRPDDAGFALVTMNRMVLEDGLQALNAAMKANVTVWEQSCLRIQSEAKSTFNHEVKTAGEEIRKSILRDLDHAKVEAAALVKYAGQPSITDIRYTWLAGTAVVFLVLAALVGGFFLGSATKNLKAEIKEQTNHATEKLVTPSNNQPVPNPNPRGGRRSSPMLKSAPK